MSPSSLEAGLIADPVMIIRRSTRSLLSVVFTLGFSLVLVGALSVLAAETAMPFWSSLLANDWLPIIPIMIVFEVVRRSSNALYILGPQALAATSPATGRVLQSALPYSRINAAHISQSNIGRFFNFGDVLVEKKDGSFGMAIRGVRNPNRLAALLTELGQGKSELVKIGERAFIADIAYQAKDEFKLAA